MNKEQKSEIIKVVPDFTKEDDWGYTRRYVGYVVVQLEDGSTHNLVNYSFNQVPSKFRKVGIKGIAKFINSGNMALWYFYPNKNNK